MGNTLTTLCCGITMEIEADNRDIKGMLDYPFSSQVFAIVQEVLSDNLIVRNGKGISTCNEEGYEDFVWRNNILTEFKEQDQRNLISSQPMKAESNYYGNEIIKLNNCKYSKIGKCNRTW